MGVPKKDQKISKRNLSTPPSSGAFGASDSIYEFGDFRLDQRERLLSSNGKPVALSPKVFDILLLLVQRSNSLVEKDTLLNEIWPDSFVEEANLSVNIATLRKALGETDDHRYIHTVPKRGYRFVATVTRREVEDHPSEEARVSSDSVARKPAETKEDSVAAHLLAVLPFENGTNDPNAEYLSDGLTDSIINSLSQVNTLRVVARATVFRYKSTTFDPVTIATHLGVRLIVSGRVLQLDDRVIVRAELVDVRNEWQLWGKQFHRKLSDVLAVQDEISEEICRALEFQLTREQRHRFTKQYTDNNEAYHLYLKGRYHWNKFSQTGLRTAVAFFTQAIQVDPRYALAYAGLADCYYRLSNIYAPTREEMPKAKAAAMKALDIDPNLPEAHAALGLSKLFYELDWLGAEKAFRRAIEINPHYSIAHQRLGLYFSLLGRFEEAEQELKLARQIDPLSPQLFWGFALMFFLARNYEQALAEVQTIWEMDNNYVPMLYLLGRTYQQLGQRDRARETFEQALALNDAPAFLAALGHNYAISGNSRAARRILEQLKARSKQRYVSAYAKAVIHVSLGEKDQAFACLEGARDERCEMLTWIKVDPAFDPIRSDLRYSNLLRRLGLDEYRQAQFATSA
ncbi:MAG: winged helix-turn-helix domain-containing protein [Pyrinomonadaceae bacterium]